MYVTLSRSARPGGISGVVRWLLGIASFLAAGALFVSPAPAAPTFQSSPAMLEATVSVEQALIAISVTPTNVSFFNCTDYLGNLRTGLLAPSGTCTTSSVAVGNQSNVQINVDVSADGQATSLGGNWNLCEPTPFSTGLACAGSRVPTATHSQVTLAEPFPGMNEFSLGLDLYGDFYLSSDPQCDPQTGCAPVDPTNVAPAIHSLFIVGPDDTTSSDVFTTHVTWLASPAL